MFSDPVVGDKFFGREETLKLLTKRANGLKDGYRQNIAILGPKLIGKSSVILEFLTHFTDSNIIPIYLDLRRNSFSHFLYKFIGAVLYHYLKNKNLTAQEDLLSLKNSAEKHIPKTVATIQLIEDDFKGGRLDAAYEKLLPLTAILKQESGLSSIVILDGFHFLDTFKIKNHFSKFAQEIMTQKDTMYILASSQISYAKKVLANELSLLFGNFEIINLAPFDYSTCCDFLEKRLEGITLAQDYKDFLIAFSEGHPFYLDIISGKLKEKTKEGNQKEISNELISQAMNSVMYDSKGILNQYFTSLLTHNLNGADYSNFLPILLSASEKGCRLQDISELAKRKSKVITKQINSLVEKDLLAKIGVFYRIQDKIFRYWLRSVYQRKRSSLAADPATESDGFCKDIEEEISRFTQQACLELTQRVMDLFKSFRNEMVTIQNKRFRFWHFKEVRLWNKAELKDCIIARYSEGYWACIVRKDDVSESEIQEFSDCCRSSKQKVKKTIIISCKELDLNVRLMALEKKIWIWSLSDLNTVLDLYGKQPIVQK
ncbi:MAG: ATP-binding protein [Candidatus Omnitrophica bacterium]|nr:ATP-binding protein [Candidatus Omnitrophota bacterium]